MKITGILLGEHKDESSISAINFIRKNPQMKIKDIIQKQNLSTDQAKRLSRYAKLLDETENHIQPTSHEKLKYLGLKSLVLVSLVKAKDWDGLDEILQSVDVDVSREKLKKMPLALNEKRKQLHVAKIRMDQQMFALQRKQRETEEALKKAEDLQKEIDQQTSSFHNYSPEAKEILLEYVGYYKNRLCLIQRLDKQWQDTLKKKGVLEYNNFHYVYYIRDIDEFAKQIEKRLKRPDWAIHYDYDKEYEKYLKNRDFSYPPSEDERYRYGESLFSTSLSEELKECKKKINAIKKEMKSIQSQVNKLKKESTSSFIDSVTLSNHLSKRDLEAHGKLQHIAMKWLFEKGYTATTELILDNGKRVDVIGYNSKGHIMIIEVKASVADFKQDDKWDTYLNYCDEYYFLTDFSLPEGQKYHISEHMFKEKAKAGFLYGETDRKGLEIKQECHLPCKPNDRSSIQFSISRSLSRKHIFGY